MFLKKVIRRFRYLRKLVGKERCTTACKVSRHAFGNCKYIKSRFVYNIRNPSIARSKGYLEYYVSKKIKMFSCTDCLHHNSASGNLKFCLAAAPTYTDDKVFQKNKSTPPPPPPRRAPKHEIHGKIIKHITRQTSLLWCH